MTNRIVAIDGLSASGKGTISKNMAKILGIPYLNTGALYRAVGLGFKKSNFTSYETADKNELLEQLKLIDLLDLDNPELFTEETGSLASRVASIQEVRQFLLKFQRDFANNKDGAILDGRDIGTVICPQASYKFYITAQLEERARRRYNELLQKGISVNYQDIEDILRERDWRDLHRPNAPLIKAQDAIELDTTNLTIEEASQKALSYIHFSN